MIKLEKVIYDPRPRNGIWCMAEYYNHPKGCPNFPVCIKKFPDFKTFGDCYIWYAVVEEFNLRDWAIKMKAAHQDWTDRQCRNPLYWQGGVRKRLKERCEEIKEWFLQGYCDIVILTIPEACGVNVFETMKKVGVLFLRGSRI